jgi:hypothetical protein
MSTASSSTSSERDERVFIAAFGMMDSHQDGEAVAAFMQVRAILQRHGGGFRRMLNRSHEAERLNEELGRQNAQLLRENTALRARDSRSAAAAPSGGARGPLVLPAIPTFRHWDIGLIGIVAISAGYGVLGVTASLILTAAILICAAFANWFSPIRFLVGILLGLTALGTVASNQSASAGAPTLAVVDMPAPVMPTTATAPYAAADATPQRPPPYSPPRAGESREGADGAPPPQSLADLPSRRVSVEPRSRRGATARVHCGPYRLQPDFTCPRSNPWGRNFFPNFARSRSVRYD